MICSHHVHLTTAGEISAAAAAQYRAMRRQSNKGRIGCHRCTCAPLYPCAPVPPCIPLYVEGLVPHTYTHTKCMHPLHTHSTMQSYVHTQHLPLTLPVGPQHTLVPISSQAACFLLPPQPPTHLACLDKEDALEWRVVSLQHGATLYSHPHKRVAHRHQHLEGEAAAQTWACQRGRERGHHQHTWEAAAQTWMCEC